MTAFYFNPYSLPFILTAVLFLGLGLYVLKQSLRSGLHIAFFGICLSCSIWQAFTALLLASLDPFWVMLSIKGLYLGVSFISVTIFNYISVWLDYASQQKKIIAAGYLLSALFTGLIWFTPWVVWGFTRYGWGPYSRLTLWGGAAFLLFFTTYMLAFFANLFVTYRKTPDPLKKKQIKIIMTAFVIAYLGSNDFLPCYGVNIFPIGAFTTLLWITALAYTIIKYKLLDIETVIHKTLMWFASTVVAVLPFAVLVYLLQNWLERLTRPQATLASMVLLVGFYFYFRALQPHLDHFFQRRRANLQAVLTRFSEELVHLKNLRDLLQGFARVTWRSLYTRRLSVFLRDKSDEQLVPAIVKRVRGLKPISLNHPFLVWLEQEDQAVLGELVQSDPKAEPFREAVKEYFEMMEAVVAVPFVLGGRLIGVAHLGMKENLRRYAPAEIHFLSQLKSAMTIAFSNSLRMIAMQENLQRWNEELEKQVAGRTQQLKETQAQLIQAEKLATIGTLAGGVAHEINNPLTAVLTNAQMLKIEVDSDNLETISLIEEGAKRCQTIIQKLLRYSRQSEREPSHQEINLVQVIKNTVSMLQYQLAQENMEITLHLEGPCSIYGIPNELEQVFTNLLLNARDAIRTTERKGKIEIHLRKKGEEAEVEIKDNGCGIKKEYLGRIFDPFFTTKEVGTGTGLGLAVSHSILQKHRCQPIVTSEEGAGTTFILRFSAPRDDDLKSAGAPLQGRNF